MTNLFALRALGFRRCKHSAFHLRRSAARRRPFPNSLRRRAHFHAARQPLLLPHMFIAAVRREGKSPAGMTDLSKLAAFVEWRRFADINIRVQILAELVVEAILARQILQILNETPLVLQILCWKKPRSKLLLLFQNMHARKLPFRHQLAHLLKLTRSSRRVGSGSERLRATAENVRLPMRRAPLFFRQL